MTQRPLFAAVLVVLGIVVAGRSPAAQQVPASGATAVPVFRGPLPVTAQSYPFLAADHDLPALDLKAAGYVEEEYLVSGAANVYDWAEDRTIAVRSASAPYTTRILVRRPAQRSRFSGAVIVEPMYPARRWDWSMIWGYTHESIIERGDAWVGITIPASIAGLQRFNPTRYADLSFKNPAPGMPCPAAPGGTASTNEDGLRWDMYSQVGALLKSSAANRPLAGFRVEAIYMTSQGGDPTTYMNALHGRATIDGKRSVYDGYVSRPPFAAARINQCVPAPPPGDPRQAVRNVGVPVIVVAAEGDLITTYQARRDDSDEPADRYRLYEVAGASHIDAHAYFGFPAMADQAAAGNAQGTPEWPFNAPCEPAIPLMPVSILGVAYDAAFANLDQWVRKGVPAPRAPRIEIAGVPAPAASALPAAASRGGATLTTPAAPQPATDEVGHARGGVRTPSVAVPLVSYATGSKGPGTCPEMGHITPLDKARLKADPRTFKTRTGPRR
jgi:hypothetical protein